MGNEGISQSECSIASWQRFYVSQSGIDVEGDVHGESPLFLDEIDEGSPVVIHKTDNGKTLWHFEDAEEMKQLGEWLLKQSQLVNSWCEHYDEIAEEFQESDKDYGWFDEKRKEPSEWWAEKEDNSNSC
jgi:hypothetical protein